MAIAQAVAGAAALFDCWSGNLGARFGLPDEGAVAALAALAVPPVLGIPGGLPVRDGGRVVVGTPAIFDSLLEISRKSFGHSH